MTEHGERWQARAQQILNKYNVSFFYSTPYIQYGRSKTHRTKRIDPEDLEKLKEQVKHLQEQLEAVMAERDALTATIQGYEGSKQKELSEVADRWRAKLEKLVTDARVKIKESKESKARVVELEAEVEGLKAQLADASGGSEAQLKALQEKLQTAEKQVEAHKSNAGGFYREVVCTDDLSHYLFMLT